MTKDLLLFIILNMTTISISQLKTHPSKIIGLSYDYPVAVEKRNKVQAYIVGKNMFEKLILFLEDKIDKKSVREADFSKGKDFEKVAQELGL